MVDFFESNQEVNKKNWVENDQLNGSLAFTKKQHN
jgi:hypothetical protein